MPDPSAVITEYDDAGLNFIAPDISTAFSESLTRKKQAVAIKQGTKSFIRATILDRSGNAADLWDYSIDNGVGQEYLDYAIDGVGSLPDLDEAAHVAVRYREAARGGTSYEVQACVIDTENGVIIFEVPSQVSSTAGIYRVDIGILNAAQEVLFTNELFLFVDPSAWATSPASTVGPPQLDDIRLSLRDSDPYENELIEELDFGLVEVCMAAVRAIQFWNDSPPKLTTYSTCNFPFREIWMLGLQAFLFEMAEEHYRRNRLPHSSGGVSVDDKNKANDYANAWNTRFQRFRQTLMHQKARINMLRGFGSFSAF